MTILEATPTDPEEISSNPLSADPLTHGTLADEDITEEQLQTARLNALAAQAQQGDIAAFGTIYAEMSSGLEAFLCTRTDPYTAQDVAQTAFVKALENLDTFKGGNFKNWLYTIAIHTHISLLRRDKRMTFTDAEVVDRQAEYSDTEAIASSRVDARELLAQSGLDEDQVVMIWLVRVLGMPYHDAAQIKGINETTARTRMFRAEGKLRRRYLAV